MREFDLIVLGGGTGNVVAARAADAGADVALVESGPLGGTCLNRGCNPSKQLIHRADLAETVRGADSFGVSATVDDVAFAEIVESVTEAMREEAEAKARRARETENLTLFPTDGRFVGDRTIRLGERGTDAVRGSEVGPDADADVTLDPSADPGDADADGDARADANAAEGAEITADRVVIAGGSRPVVPDSIDGVHETPFMTSADALRRTQRPDSLAIVGGGYVAAELGHFYGALGTDVTVIGSADRLLPREDREVAETFTEAFARRHEVVTGRRATAVAGDADGVEVRAESADEDGARDAVTVEADALLLAVGRRPNSDAWDVAAGGVATDDDGFVETDDRLATSAEGVWAIGDVAGNYMLKHSGDREAAYVVRNAVRGDDAAVAYPGMAHAVFGWPKVAALGRTEHDLADAGREYRTGRCAYDDTAMGTAVGAHDGFVKVLADADAETVLGCHAVGPEAPTLIHEVSVAVTAAAASGDESGDRGGVGAVRDAIHVHPTLSEVVAGAFADLD